jgi:hypothetical protein
MLKSLFTRFSLVCLLVSCSDSNKTNFVGHSSKLSPLGGTASRTSDDSARAGNAAGSSPQQEPQPEPQPQGQYPPKGNLLEQTVQQPDNGKVDILWVVDDSGSMAWAQKELAEKFSSFVHALSIADINFHLGVTTTSMCLANKRDEFCPDGTLHKTHRERGNLVPAPGDTARFLANSAPSRVLPICELEFVSVAD